MTEDRVRLQLTAVVNYEPHGTPIEELKRLLKVAIDHAHDNGLLSGDTDAEVGLYEVRVDELAPECAATNANKPTGAPMAILSPYMDRYDELLSQTAEREGWDDEELRAVICRYIAHVDQFVDSIDGLQDLNEFLQAECRRANAALRERSELALDVYATIEHATESFEEEHIGADLAYLLGAILRGSGCEWDTDRPFVRLLRKCVHDEHAVWRSIHLVESDETDAESPFGRAQRVLGDVLDSAGFHSLEQGVQAEVRSTLRCLSGSDAGEAP
jgi:hypothetical protein